MDDLPTLGAHHGADRSTLSGHAMQGPYGPAPGVDELSFALYPSTGVELTPGHRAEILDDGAVCDAIVEDIRRARIRSSPAATWARRAVRGARR